MPERVRAAASPEQLRLVRRRTRPTAMFIVRLVVTAVASYLIALGLQSNPAPLLAPLTALLVVQASLFQTIKHAGQRVISVIAGVMVAVVLVATLGFAWWSLAVTIGAALVVGYALRLGAHILEVPISAMLVLQLGTETAAADRILETLIGAGVGLLAGLIASPVRVQPAEEAIAELGRSMGSLLDGIAGDLGAEPDKRTVESWLERSRRLGQKIQRVDDELGTAEDSVRLNPRARGLVFSGLVLRGRLEALEHATVTLRGLARSLADRTGLVLADRAGLGAEMWEADVRDRLAAVLRELAAAARFYGSADSADDPGRVRAGVDRHLSEGRRYRDELGRLLREDPGHWPLHGELLVHLDRLLDGLRAEHRAEAPRRRPPESGRPGVQRVRAPRRLTAVRRPGGGTRRAGLGESGVRPAEAGAKVAGFRNPVRSGVT
ncbi:FUSC family protein [Actinomadura scrupuli]|uniref:FUSC family protein n=1 Tax=Actinomadura scrupuli TaxID=559629 RepID=UPI003D99A4FA